jgi:hypothetical protein
VLEGCGDAAVIAAFTRPHPRGCPQPPASILAP